MSRQSRRETSVLKAKVKEHISQNPVFRSDLLDWIEAEKERLVKNLIQENNENTRGQIQMLDNLKEAFQMGG